jgi:hypothetical protein
MDVFREKFPVSGPTAGIVEESTDDAFLAAFRERRQTASNAEKEPEKFRCVVLLPLGKKQIEVYASANGVTEPKALLAEIHRREAWTFARRPLDLKGQIAVWNDTGRLGTQKQQHEIDVENSLRDDPDRADQGVLTLDRATEGAERLALAMLLTKTRTLRAPEQVGIEPPDASSLDSALILTDWTEAQLKALLRRPIFDPATYGRVRFHHRSVQEFLAARRLKALLEKGLSKRKMLSMLFADTYGERITIPSMRPIIAWLSGMCDDVCREVLKREPEVLILYGDPESLPLATRLELVRCYVAAYTGGGWRGLQMPIAEFQRLAKPDLASEIRSAWKKKHSNEEIHEFLLKLIWLGAIRDCADIASSALMDASLGTYARTIAARALGECKKTEELRRAAKDMFARPNLWPDRIVYTIADELFPDVISTRQLEKLLRRTQEPTRTVGGFSWTLYNLVDRLKPESIAATSLRDLLAKLIWEGRNIQSEWHRLTSKVSYLTPALAKLCVRQLKSVGKTSPALIRASVIARRFHGDNVVGREEIAELTKQYFNIPRIREATFWADYEVLESLTKADRGITLYQIQRDGLISAVQSSDWKWLLLGLKKPNSGAREVALRGLLDVWLLRGRSDNDLKQLKRAAHSDARLSQILIEQTTPHPPNRDLERMEREHQRYIAQQKVEQEQVEQSWVDWKHKAEADPAACFCPARAENSMWVLLKWLGQQPSNHSQLGYESWQSVRLILGGVIADGFEAALRAYWRKTRPPVWSRRLAKERNTIWNPQHAALTGLLIEASAGESWTKELDAKEARRAAEWGLTEINGTPKWLADLAITQPKAVRGALEAELKVELAEIAELPHPRTLQVLRYGDEVLRCLAAPFLLQAIREWPQASKQDGKSDVCCQNLDVVLSIIILAGGANTEVANICEHNVLAEKVNPATIIWFRGLCACNLSRATRVFRAVLKRIPKSKRATFALDSIGSIFGDRDRFRLPVPLIADANLLVELVTLAYEYVRREDDIQHDGVYSPGPRDEAETARNHLLNALIGNPGAESYKAIKMLAGEPLFAHMKDRLILLARERAANDSEATALLPRDFLTWEKQYDYPPRTRNELFTVMLDRLEDIEHDIRHHDFSDRHILAGINHEIDMQPLLARKLEDAARGQYKISREEEVADKKKTDIRLLASASDQRAVIEVKIGDKWNVRQLESALKKQLVDQYLRHVKCTAGCFLVTYAGRTQFFDARTRKPISFENVISSLQAKATKLEAAENGRIRLSVFGLDLRSPLPPATSKRKTPGKRNSRPARSGSYKRPTRRAPQSNKRR